MIDRHISRKDETQFGLPCPADLRQRLDAWCEAHDELIGSVVSRALTEFLDATKREMPPYLATRRPSVMLYVWLRDELGERFVAKAATDGITQSSLLITALERFFQRNNAPNKKSQPRKKPSERRRSRNANDE